MIALQIVQLIVCVILTAVVLFQSGKKAGLGAVSGAAETFLSKNKARGVDAVLAKATKWVAVAFAVLTLSLHLVH